MNNQNVTNDIENIIDDFMLEDLLGVGAYGSVYKALEISTRKYYAVKKIPKAFDEFTLAKRTLREIKILKMLKHENIISLHKLIRLKTEDRDVYIVLDLMETDLHRVIYSDQQLTEKHIKHFLHQLVKGLKYIHNSKIIHRDLKPSNILVNSNCSLKIGDFGMARSLNFLIDGQVSNQDYLMTQYVATRWYRAPELVFNRNYSEKIDIWSLGCIMSELVTRRPLFPSKNCINSLKLIFSLVELPTQEFCNSIPVPLVKEILIESFKDNNYSKLRSMHASLIDSGFNLLNKLICIDFDKRFNTQEILNHPYLENYNRDENEPSDIEPFDFSFEIELSLNDLTKEGYLTKIKNALIKEFWSDDESIIEKDQDIFIPQDNEDTCIDQFITEEESAVEETIEKKINVKDLLKKKLERNLLSTKDESLKQLRKSKKNTNNLDKNVDCIDLSNKQSHTKIKKNVKILPKPSHQTTNQILLLTQPAIIVSQYPLVLINTQAPCNYSTLTMQNRLTNLNFEEQANPNNNQNSMDLTITTPKGTADGYSIGIDYDALMSEVIDDSDILRNITDFPSIDNINELNNILNENKSL